MHFSSRFRYYLAHKNHLQESVPVVIALVCAYADSLANDSDVHKMEIIQAQPCHLPQLVPVFDAYRVFYQQESDLNLAEAFLRQRIEKQESVIFLAIDEKGKALGFTQLYPNFSSVSAKRTWQLNDLYVVKSARRQGVAKALMEHACQFAKRGGVKGIALETAESNHSAQRLYESLGYVKERGTYHYFLSFIEPESTPKSQ